MVFICPVPAYFYSVKDYNLFNLINSKVPVIFANGKNFGNPIMDAFQDHMVETLQLNENLHEIDNSIKSIFNKDQKQAAININNLLTLRKEKDIIYLELKRNNDDNSKRNQDRIKRAIAFMEKHYDEEISLLQIAQSAFLSPCHFCRLFKKQVGTTCSKYLSILRINKARELLREKELSVTEICFKVGFNDLTHFERVFKGLEGTTPSVYRRSA